MTQWINLAISVAGTMTTKDFWNVNTVNMPIAIPTVTLVSILTNLQLTVGIA